MTTALESLNLTTLKRLTEVRLDHLTSSTNKTNHLPGSSW